MTLCTCHRASAWLVLDLAPTSLWEWKHNESVPALAALQSMCASLLGAGVTVWKRLRRRCSGVCFDSLSSASVGGACGFSMLTIYSLASRTVESAGTP